MLTSGRALCGYGRILLQSCDCAACTNLDILQFRAMVLARRTAALTQNHDHKPSRTFHPRSTRSHDYGVGQSHPPGMCPSSTVSQRMGRGQSCRLSVHVCRMTQQDGPSAQSNASTTREVDMTFDIHMLAGWYCDGLSPLISQREIQSSCQSCHNKSHIYQRSEWHGA